MLENKTTIWVDNLRKVENYKNNTFTSAIDNFPNKIWTVTNKPIDFKLDGDDTQLQQTYAKRTILKMTGDHVTTIFFFSFAFTKARILFET